MAGIEFLRVVWSSDDGNVVASLVGEIDMHAAEVVIGIVRVSELAPRLVLDLTSVTFVDAAGLTMLRTLAALANVTVRNPSVAVARLLELVGDAEI